MVYWSLKPRQKMITKWKEGESEKFKIKTPSSNEERGSQNVRSLKPKFDAMSNFANLKPLSQTAQSTKCHRLFYPIHPSPDFLLK